MRDLLEVSQPSFSDKLQVFSCPPTEAAIQSVEWVEVRPVGQVSIKIGMLSNSTYREIPRVTWIYIVHV